MTVVELLTRAKARIATPERWTQYTNARDTNGAPCSSDDKNAICWCMNGAILCEARTGEVEHLEVDAIRLLAAGQPARTESGLGPWNDKTGRTHAEVLAAFDRAIALATAKGSSDG